MHLFDRHRLYLLGTLALLLCTVACAGWALAMPASRPVPGDRPTFGLALAQTPATTAATALRVVNLQWRDSRREREVPAKLFWPTQRGESRSANLTLIVFSHGMGSSREGYLYLGRYWAKHGIASLHVQHVGSDRTLWQGNPLTLTERFKQAAGDTEAIARVHDMRFALDQLLASRRGAAIDPQRIVAAGHSYGATTTLLLAGARVLRDGQRLDLSDRRYAAAILLSAPPFHDEADMRPILGAIGIPTLHVTSLDDVIQIPGFESDLEDRRRVFAAIGGAKTLAVYQRGSHNVYTHQRYLDSPETAAEIKGATELLTLNFVQQVQGHADYLRGFQRSHGQLFAQFVLAD